MTLSQLAPIDWIIVLIYFIAVIGIGIFVKHLTKTGTDFFLAGRRNSSWVAGIAFLSANAGALELLGMSGQSYKYGLLTAHFYFVGAIPAMLFLGIFMIPFYYASRIHSIPAYLNWRFNGATRTLNAFAFAIMTLLMSGINLYAMSLVLNIFVGWNITTAMFASSIAIAIYVGIGGLTSAIFTELLQFFLIWGGILLAVILGFIHVGWHGLSQLPPGFIHLWADTGSATHNPLGIDWWGIVFGLGFVLSFGYWTTDFLVVQRAFSAKDVRSAQMTPILASFFKMLLPILVVLSGLIVVALQKQIPGLTPSRPDDTLLVLLNKFYPHGLLGLGVTGLLAGFMAGQAGNISAFNTVFTYDIYKAHLYKIGSDRHYLWIGRVATIVGVCLSIVTAYWAMGMPTIMEYMQALFSIVNAPLFATILLGMFWKRINGYGAFWGLFTGMITSTIMFLLVQFKILPISDFALSAAATPMAGDFWRAIWAWLITFILTIIISLITPAQAIENLKGLVYGLTKIEKYQQLSWYKRPIIWAWISLILLMIINIVLW